MSYVLNALRRADAERARGGVPDLHAQPLPPAAPPAVDTARAGRWVPALAAVALIALLVGGWLVLRPSAAPQGSAAAVPAAPVAAVAGPGPTAPGAAGSGSAGAGAAPMAPAPPPAPVVIRIEAPPAPPPVVASPPQRPRDTAPGASDRGNASASAGVTPMPDAVRRQLPPMTFGGAMDSTQADGRMLIINGQVYREGESPVPGMVLERIKLRSAIVSVGGQRFEMAY